MDLNDSTIPINPLANSRFNALVIVSGRALFVNVNNVTDYN